jgi:hypothetical protein
MSLLARLKFNFNLHLAELFKLKIMRHGAENYASQNIPTRPSFTRLTNGHSKKVENHCHALALYFLHYNWMRPNQALDGKTPAMAAKLTTTRLSMADLVGMIDRAGLEERLGLYSN